MRVIGAGMGRTGTLSLKAALERLGFGPCHHMMEVIEHPGRIPLWAAAARGEPPDWERLLGGYQATTDWPACTFWRGLVEAYPDAKVLLSVRDPERWYESMLATVYGISTWARTAPPDTVPAPMRQLADMAQDLIWQGTFGGRFEDREHAIAVFRRHNDEVRDGVPAERLLVYEVGQGWGPLCDFLGVPVPAEPFPRLNDAASFHARVEEGTLPGLLGQPPPPGPPGRP
jgi:hypothetical protein